MCIRDSCTSSCCEEALFEEIEQIRVQYGFDRPIFIRYIEWLGGIFQGDFGVSYYWNKPVGTLLLDRAPQTITLALMSVTVTIIVAIPLGILAALNPNTRLSHIALYNIYSCLLYTSPSPRDLSTSRMPSSA